MLLSVFSALGPISNPTPPTAALTEFFHADREREREREREMLIDICLPIYIYIYIYHRSPCLTKERADIENEILFSNPSARAGYDTRSIFKRSLTDLNSEFSFS